MHWWHQPLQFQAEADSGEGWWWWRESECRWQICVKSKCPVLLDHWHYFIKINFQLDFQFFCSFSDEYCSTSVSFILIIIIIFSTVFIALYSEVDGRETLSSGPPPHFYNQYHRPAVHQGPSFPSSWSDQARMWICHCVLCPICPSSQFWWVFVVCSFLECKSFQRNWMPTNVRITSLSPGNKYIHGHGWKRDQWPIYTKGDFHLFSFLLNADFFLIICSFFIYFFNHMIDKPKLVFFFCQISYYKCRKSSL